MSQAELIIERFGGIAALARALGHANSSTVQGWKERGFIPFRHHEDVLGAARDIGLNLSGDDFLSPELKTALAAKTPPKREAAA